MNRYSFTIAGRTCERITKNAARKLYDSNKPVYFCPCKLRPGEPWNPELLIEKSRTDGATFAYMINSATFYNCTSETGRYLAFYAPID